MQSTAVTKADVARASGPRVRRFQEAATLLRKWIGEDPEYDERVGAALDQEWKVDFVRCEEQDETSA